MTWFKEGLRFSCTECGKCCTGAPGYIWVTEEEMIQIADYLGISIDEFAKKYVKKVGSRYSLLERPPNGDCVFLKDRKCSIYPVRPKQCATYPWWSEILSSKERWEAEAKECEGINPDAELVPYEKILEQL